MTNDSTLREVFDCIISAGEHCIDDGLLAELVRIIRPAAAKLRRTLFWRGVVILSRRKCRGTGGKMMHIWVWTGIELD